MFEYYEGSQVNWKFNGFHNYNGYNGWYGDETMYKCIPAEDCATTGLFKITGGSTPQVNRCVTMCPPLAGSGTTPASPQNINPRSTELWGDPTEHTCYESCSLASDRPTRAFAATRLLEFDSTSTRTCITP